MMTMISTRVVSTIASQTANPMAMNAPWMLNHRDVDHLLVTRAVPAVRLDHLMTCAIASKPVDVTNPASDLVTRELLEARAVSAARDLPAAHPGDLRKVLGPDDLPVPVPAADRVHQDLDKAATPDQTAAKVADPLARQAQTLHAPVAGHAHPHRARATLLVPPAPVALLHAPVDPTVVVVLVQDVVDLVLPVVVDQDEDQATVALARAAPTVADLIVADQAAVVPVVAGLVDLVEADLVEAGLAEVDRAKVGLEAVDLAVAEAAASVKTVCR